MHPPVFSTDHHLYTPMPGPTFASVTPVFLVGDIAATMRWYRTHLGFQGAAVPPEPPHTFAIIRRDRVSLMLQQLTGYRGPDLYDWRDGGVWHAYIQTSDVAGLYRAVKDNPEVHVLAPLCHQDYGQTEFVVADPNGYVLVFAEPDGESE